MRMNMNKSGIKYIALSAIITLALTLTGCPHNSNAPVSSAKTIRASGSVIIPSALPSEYAAALENDSSRTAASSYAQTKDGSSLSIIVYAVNQNDETNRLEVTTSVTGTFNMDFPAELSEWIIGAKCYKGDQLLMETTPRTISINQQDIESGSFKIRPFTLDPSSMTGTGSLSLPFTKAEGSSITTIKYELSSQSLSTPISGQLNFGLNSSINLAYSSLDAGTYEATFYFINESQIRYGPVKETLIIAPEFLTDTWYASADDAFIVSEVFQVPSDDIIQELFPNYTYIGSIPENTALLWNYDPVTLKASYKVHPVDENGNVSSYGFSLAADKDIADVFIDFANNDMYVLTKENSLLQYTASSGYSEYKENIAPSQNYTLITACANQGTVYVLANNSGAEPDKQARIMKFNTAGTEFTEIGCPSGVMVLPGSPVKMATCDGYIFISWLNISFQTYSLCCDVFNENKRDSQDNLLSCWNSGTQTLAFNDVSNILNDLHAVSKGGTGIPDVYLLLGTVLIDEPDLYSVGGIRKISSTYNADDLSYSAAWAGDYGTGGSNGFAGFYPDIGCAPEEQASSYFYNPLKIVGKTDDKFLIADDGLLFKYVQTGKNEYKLQIENLDRLVTVDLTSMNPIPFADTQSVEAGFDNCYTGNFCMNYKQPNPDGFSSASFFVQTNEEQATISLFDGLEVALYNDAQQQAPTTTLPSKKNQTYYIKTNPQLPNAVYNAKLLCNGKDLNLDSEGNPLAPEERYYNIDPETGAFSLNKPLNFVECYYKLVIDMEISLMQAGQAETIHYDANLDVSPVTNFEIIYPKPLEAFHGLLDSFLIADYANVIVKVNQYTGKDFDPVYSAADFVRDIVEYYNEHPCDCLTLDFSGSAGLTTVTSGMFGIDCAGIKLPDSVLTIEANAFSNNDVVFKGDLEFPNTVTEIAAGAFVIPPRSLVERTTSNSVPAYQVCTTNNNVTLLAKRQNQKVGDSYRDIIIRIITCTKRDEPFELDLTDNLKFNTTSVSIDQYAFKGLPVTKVTKVTGATYDVGQDAFADAPVAGEF